MKKIILLSVLAPMFFARSVFAGVPTIFSDSNYSQSTNNFSTGQTVYLRYEWSGSGDKEKTLRILDSDKKEINRFSLNQSGGYYTASFAAPGSAGIYYVDTRIDSGSGSVFNNQQNINVGGATGGSVKSSATSDVSVTTKGGVVSGQNTGVPTNPPTVRLSPVPTSAIDPTISPESELKDLDEVLVENQQKKPTFFEKIRNVVSQFFNLFRPR